MPRKCDTALTSFANAPDGRRHERPIAVIALFIDADNLSKSEWIDEACRKLTAKWGRMSVRRAYGSAEKLKGLSKELHAHAIRPFVNLPVTKNTTDLALAVDCMEMACQTPALTTVAIGSGDADFFPLVVRLRERGIRMICVSRKDVLADDASLFLRRSCSCRLGDHETSPQSAGRSLTCRQQAIEGGDNQGIGRGIKGHKSSCAS